MHHTATKHSPLEEHRVLFYARLGTFCASPVFMAVKWGEYLRMSNAGFIQLCISNGIRIKHAL